MNQMLKWIGGATAATVIILGGATLASSMMEDDGASTEVALEEAIPVDPAQLADKQEGDGAQLQPASSAADEAFTVKRILDIDGPIKYGEWHWNTDNVPADGAIVMTVDLEARVISVFKGGYEIGASAVLLGTDEHPTPLGTFPIKYKMRHNVSEKYDNAPMPYSMFLTNDGIALHGSDVQNGYASHGCIGMPDDFAAKVFAVAKKGDKVIITNGETLDMGQSIL
ncbi:L,D-transpeptidase family protein [Qipengyuania sp. CAU 1752]